MSNPQPPGGAGYLTGYPVQAPTRRKGRRDKPLRKFHIPCLEQTLPLPPRVFTAPNPKPYVPLTISDWVQHPIGTGKAAKKARRRLRKRLAKKQARVQAEVAAKKAQQDGLDDAEAQEKQRLDAKELYQKIGRENAEAEIQRNLVKTRSMSKKAKEDRKAANKTRREEEKKGVFEASKKPLRKVKDASQDKGAGDTQEINKQGKKRKATDVDDEPTSNKKTRGDDYTPNPHEAGYENAVAQAKAGKGKVNTVSNADTGKDNEKSKKRKRDEDAAPEDSIKKNKTAHNTDTAEVDESASLFEFSSDDDSEDNASIASSSDPIFTLPVPYTKPDSLLSFPDEILERIISHLDPISATLAGLTCHRLGKISLASGAGFPSFRDRYGSDLERHRFMSLLYGFMNRSYAEAAEPITLVEHKAREKKKERRLCYICRKYLPIEGKKCQYWKNCKRSKDMPWDPKSVAARATEVERRRQTTCQAVQAQTQAQAAQPNTANAAAGPSLLRPATQPALLTSTLRSIRGINEATLPKITKQKPKAQTFTWKDEDWTTLSLGLVKSRERIPDVKHICPKCTLTVHTIHLGWPPETPIVRWLEDGNPAGGKMSMGHEPLSAWEMGEVELGEEWEGEMLDLPDGVGGGEEGEEGEASGT